MSNNMSIAGTSKSVVALCDGTGNHLGADLSNIARVFRCLDRSGDQRAFYNSGVGTVGGDMWWSSRARGAKALFQQATGYGIDQDVVKIYRFICMTYEPGDRLFLFGFSRGAYAARIVASLLHVIGVLPRDQINLVGYALSYLKIISDRGGEATKSDFERIYQFARIAGARTATVWFLGLFDTVSSLILPGRNGPFPGLATLPYTRRNPSVRAVRHAAAIDERRAMFRLNRWDEPQPFVSDPFRHAENPAIQDVKQVWFAGVHSDIGGGYPEHESGLAKIALLWMLREAEGHGLKLDERRVRRFALGAHHDDEGRYTKPDSTSILHDSLKGSFAFELVPKSSQFAETVRPPWPVYLPLGEWRNLTRTRPCPLIHQSVIDRVQGGSYSPPNLPSQYEVEPWHANPST